MCWALCRGSGKDQVLCSPRQKLYKKDLHDPDNHNGVITHLEPEILECKVKWALESFTMDKASGGDGISVALFQILKDDAVKVLHSICQLLLLPLLSRFSRVQLCVTPEMAAHQVPPSLGFSRQEYGSGLPVPSPMHESKKWKWSLSVMSDSSRPHGLQPTRCLRPWDSPGKVATGLEKVRFYSNPKERQYQRMLKPSHNCTHLTR